MCCANANQQMNMIRHSAYAFGNASRSSDGASKEGMQTMDQCLRDLYAKGQITYDDAVTRAMQPEELKKMISGGASMGSGGPGSPGGSGGGRQH